MVIDGVVAALTEGRQTYDRNGRWARRGKVCEKLVCQCMQHPFIKRRPPRTTGREEFGEQFIRRLMASARRCRLADADIVATATAFTALSIADAYRRFVFPKLNGSELAHLQIILGGGGAKNPTLCRMLSEQVGIGELLTHEDFGIGDEAKEALAFAILAHATLSAQPANVPGATGARHPVVLGKVIPA